MFWRVIFKQRQIELYLKVQHVCSIVDCHCQIISHVFKFMAGLRITPSQDDILYPFNCDLLFLTMKKGEHFAFVLVSLQWTIITLKSRAFASQICFSHIYHTPLFFALIELPDTFNQSKLLLTNMTESNKSHKSIKKLLIIKD